MEFVAVYHHVFALGIHAPGVQPIEEIPSPAIGGETRSRAGLLPQKFPWKKFRRRNRHFLRIELRMNQLPRPEPSPLQTDRKSKRHRDNRPQVSPKLHFLRTHALGEL